LSFKVASDRLAKQQAAGIVTRFGQSQAAAIVSVIAGTNPVVTVPGQLNTIFGNAVNFTLSATDPNALPLTFSAASLPSGAGFDANTGSFSWTPEESQQGLYQVIFTVTNTASGAATADVNIQVDAGKPVITEVRNAASQLSGSACSPGSVGTLAGRWLAPANPPASDPTGASKVLGGASVNINGAYVPILYASPERIDFVCPAADPGTVLNIVVEKENDVANAVQVTMQAFAPGLYSVAGSGQGQGLVMLSGTTTLATPRTYLGIGQPAEPGDSITILATGLGSLDTMSAQVKIGDFSVAADAVQPADSMAGFTQIIARLPYGLPVEDALPLAVEFTTPDGTVVRSNTVTIAVEGPRP
jgi:uncharacterized protein (TIGR03437 family)